MSPPRRALIPVLCAILALQGLTGCGSNPPPPDSSTPVAPEAMSDPKGSEAQDAPTTRPGTDLSGRTVAIDPGHNGGNASHPNTITRSVPDGRGGTKACNTTGTATGSDYPESDFTWGVGQKLKHDLEDAGAEVVMSRDDNDSVGPCVDERGTFADDADLMVSIHANGSESTKVKGFHVIVAQPGRSQKAEDDSNRLAEAMSQALATDFTSNKAYGKNAISRRPDLAGLNNASVPAVIVECGEMRNPSEAKTMESKSGQQKYAKALMQGIVDWY
ncbi:N-acetylmuramoyl-L-alanine amidase [Brevibacterium antiquum]|uniref:N-acetylmuramoyl-L-alanine amidase n=1 Tax=Brevibacterium antiquum TaxID=234835 RepID=A0A2H1HMG7_9MICO|nr:N-acetylmuramoyl-L-alanine amidase [Brevibacterium antiquum]SMX64112.1 N-acetylmuramoyl-L-alanine amidase [Brevibacterium antiquum]